MDAADCTRNDTRAVHVASTKERELFDNRAKYLDHLTREYKRRLYVVLYATKGSGLLRENVVLYWILEDSSWKVAMFQGTD